MAPPLLACGTSSGGSVASKLSTCGGIAEHPARPAVASTHGTAQAARSLPAARRAIVGDLLLLFTCVLRFRRCC
jgi:hypothetical protein